MYHIQFFLSVVTFINFFIGLLLLELLDNKIIYATRYEKGSFNLTNPVYKEN